MFRSVVRVAALLGCLGIAGAARADFASVLQPTPITASSSVAFHDSNVTVGRISADHAYNFLDSWSFTLDGSFQVSSIAAAIDFTDASGQSVLFGITNLQVNLVTDPPSGSPLVSWATVSAPAAGLKQTVALIPPHPLGSGDYRLQVRGYVSTPGSYSGSLIAQPLQTVPVPKPSALFACAVLAIGFTMQRLRRR